jgi:hypothetical protein
MMAHRARFLKFAFIESPDGKDSCGTIPGNVPIFRVI